MSQKGQALIILIVAIAISLLVLTSAILRAVGQAKISAREKLSQKVYLAAESGLETGIMKIMRNPNNCNGNSVYLIGNTNVTVNYNLLGSDCELISEASEGNIIKKIRLEGSYDTNYIFNYCCWQEIP